MPVPNSSIISIKTKDKKRMRKLRIAQSEADWEVIHRALNALETQTRKQKNVKFRTTDGWLLPVKK